MCAQDSSPIHLFKSLEANEKRIREIFTNCDDVVFRHVQIGSHQNAMLLFVANLVKEDLLDAAILRKLLGGIQGKRTVTIDDIRTRLLSISEIQPLVMFSEVEASIVSGDAVLLVEGYASGLGLVVLGWEHRGVEKAENEVSIRGPAQAFTENMMNNIALIRRYICNAHLKVEKRIIGEATKTPYCVVYIDGVADAAIIQELKSRLKRRKIEKVIAIGYLEEQIRDAPWSPFPTVNKTERPDRVVAQLLEGRVAILVENSPIVMTVPALFVEFLQTPEDYYGDFLLQSAIRMLRYFAFAISLILPSLYVAISAFHHEIIPSSFLTALMDQREGVPLPTIVEVLIMEVTFEILREAGLRLPTAIGQTVSIVGALVIGQAAVQAHFVMASTVIIVATTGIASFTIPGFSLSAATRLLRFPLLIATGIFGLLGLSLGILVMLFHLVSLRSFGVIYTASLTPRTTRDVRDTIFRVPKQFRMDTPWVGKKKRI